MWNFKFPRLLKHWKPGGADPDRNRYLSGSISREHILCFCCYICFPLETVRFVWSRTVHRVRCNGLAEREEEAAEAYAFRFKKHDRPSCETEPPAENRSDQVPQETQRHVASHWEALYGYQVARRPVGSYRQNDQDQRPRWSQKGLDEFKVCNFQIESFQS